MESLEQLLHASTLVFKIVFYSIYDYCNDTVPTILHTIYLTMLQERYHGVQDVMTTPWPLTQITLNKQKLKHGDRK